MVSTKAPPDRASAASSVTGPGLTSALRAVVVGALRRQWPALALATLLWGGMVAVGYGTGRDGASLIAQEEHVASVSSWWDVLANNALIALGLFSGVVCLGLVTALLTVTSATVLGMMTVQAIDLLGWGEFARHVGPHLIPEMGSFILATAAGLASLVAVARRIGGWSERLGPAQVLRDASTLMVLSLMGLTVAATIETWVS